MTSFNHTPDNYIVIRNADMNYHAELSQFQADLLALSLPAYGGLEAPWCRRLYSQEQQLHCLFDGTIQAAPANITYPDADIESYFANFGGFLARSAARKLAETAPEDAQPTPPTPASPPS